MTGPMWVTLIVGVLGGTAGLAALANAFFGRKKTTAEATQIVVGSVVSAMNEFEEAAKEANETARQAYTELRTVRDEAVELAKELHRIRMAIMRPDATIEGLRALVASGPGPGTNGRSYP
ncbi:hypothetical protein ACFP2T_13445 [Plantactinospora solaniradicis]|uniref:DUF2746 domain-containing protein n=1 Tax=Plantactinospora solaniradicis TaxID=1723736 RepID=A0ABW1K5Z7_9ACTN